MKSKEIAIIIIRILTIIITIIIIITTIIITKIIIITIIIIIITTIITIIIIIMKILIQVFQAQAVLEMILLQVLMIKFKHNRNYCKSQPNNNKLHQASLKK